LTTPYVLDSRAPLPKERQHVPSLMRHSAFMQAYQSLVQNYGIPRYGEFDPTLLFMVTFLLMFGVMFGDVGQGAVIAGFGWLMRDKLKQFSLFFIAAGGFSIIFGFLYGSVFGIEETIIPALWVSPLHHPFYMLKMALYWGVGFILVMTLLKVINNWRFGHHAEAMFNSNGIAGILLYLGGFFSLKMWMETGGDFGQLQQLSIILPLSVILSYKWYENKLPLGERILVTLIEGLETLINYLANTLSFLRVAAFSLNHVALAIAIFTLADMMGEGTLAYWFMAILGNLVIIVLEGAIVTIQVLRLEYYEGFSRFFSADGRLFEPLKASIKNSA
jgi:V/A-type H+-transporting ATPase subunit I